MEEKYTQQDWDKMRKNIQFQIKPLPPSQKYAVNNSIFQEAEKVMRLGSLSLIYDKYGNQLYEKNSDIYKYIMLKKTGDSFLMAQDDSKLVPTKNKNDENNSDFIPYDQIEDINKNNVKYDLDIDSDFEEYNSRNLYLQQAREKRKEKIYSDGIKEIKDFVNDTGKKKLIKINPNLVTLKI